MNIIEQKNNHSFPSPVNDAEDLCINCGHCVAVCPQGALSLENMTPDQCPPINNEWILNPEQTEHFLRSRRSIRTYKDMPVNKETIKKLIEISSYAPSGHNMQPVEWMVIYKSRDVHKLAGYVIDWMRFMLKEQPDVAIPLHFDRVIDSWENGRDSVCRNAPHLVIAHAHKSNRAAPAASAIALAYMELAAPSFNVGACWAGFFNAAAASWPSIQEVLSLPEGHTCYGSLLVGYPKYNYHRLPLRKEPEIMWC